MGISDEAVVNKARADAADAIDSAAGVELFRRISSSLNRVLAWISGASLLLLMLVVVLNGVSRLIDVSVPGATEIVGWLGAISTAFSLGYTQLNNGHVDIDILVQKFPDSLQSILKKSILLASTVFFGLVSWQVVVFGLNVAGAGNVSETLGWPFYPLIFLMALGFAGFTAVLLVELLQLVLGRAN